MRSAASYEARSCEELRRIPFLWLKQKLILARALKRVKEARHKEEPTHIVIPPVELKCVSPKRRKEMAARFGGRAGRRARSRLPALWPIRKDPTLPQTSHLTMYAVIRFGVEPITHHGRGRE